MQFEYSKGRLDSALFNCSLFSIKVLITIVYLFAGIHKINPYFHDGLLLGDILSEGILRRVLSDEILYLIAPFFAKGSMIMELSVPILIWTRYRTIGVIIAILTHFGISFFGGKGILFNLYLPAVFVLFYDFSSISWNINSKRVIKKNERLQNTH